MTAQLPLAQFVSGLTFKYEIKNSISDGGSKVKESRLRNASSEFPSLAVSIYAPTHKKPPEKKQDRIVVKNLVREAEETIAKHGSEKLEEDLLRNLQEAFQSIDWEHTQEGICLLVSEAGYKVLDLHHSPVAQVTVGSEYSITELARTRDDAQEYYLLVLSEKPTRLFEGKREKIREIKVKEKFPYFHTGFGGSAGLPREWGEPTNMIVDENHRQFFRDISNFLSEIRHQDQKPLFITGVEKWLAFWQEVAPENPPVDSFEGNYDFMSTTELSKTIWPKILSSIEEKNRAKLSLLKQAVSNKMYSQGFEDLYSAAKDGRIDMLFVATEYVSEPAVEKVVRHALDTAAELVFLDEETMGDFSPMAARLRY